MSNFSVRVPKAVDSGFYQLRARKVRSGARRMPHHLNRFLSLKVKLLQMVLGES